LSQFKEKLLDYHTTSTKSILPLNRKQEVIEWLEGNLDDLSISRSITRLQWGIPVPDDDTQVMYVWFEALINYLTVTGYPNTPNKLLPTDLHVIGKDIVRFHAVYYPAILMALNLPLPTTLLTHGHWTMNNQKMSKSIGNVVDPINLVETVFKFDADPIRYYLLRDGGNFQMDGDWSNDTLKVKVNKELNGQLGNLMSRISGKKLNPKLVIPAYSAVKDFKLESFDSLIQALNAFPDQFKLHFENFELGKSIQLSVDLLTLVS
jgi:methionyl-tRNA synthetase